MVLAIVKALANKYYPSQYTPHIAVSLLTLVIFRAFVQGRKTDRERDLHARVFLVTGGFTPLGITLLQQLAQRGAHIIALSEDPIDSPNITILVSLLRTTTNNEKIFAEQCDLSNPHSIRAFCTQFLTGEEQRLDGVVFAHEHRHIGSPTFLYKREAEDYEKARETGSLATFLITTLLLPVLLVAPAERDIRIVNVVNPFYAAAAGLPFSPITGSKLKSNSILLMEGVRSLRSIVYMRHLQRILDALPVAPPPKAEEGITSVPVAQSKHQKSNIATVSVSPGVNRQETIAPFLRADWSDVGGYSYLGIFIYILLQPLLRIFTKSSSASIQTVLHALFLPTPFKILSQTTFPTASASGASQSGEAAKPPTAKEISSLEMPQELLRPGGLYSNCALVSLRVNVDPELVQQDKEKPDPQPEKGKGKGKGKQDLKEEVLDLEDDGEYGGELAGRLVWETFEQGLKVWEANSPVPPPVEKPPVDTVPPAPKVPSPPVADETTDPYS